RGLAVTRGPLCAALSASAGRLGGVLRAAVASPRRGRRSRHCLHDERPRSRGLLEPARPMFSARRPRRGRRRGAPLCPVAPARPALAFEAAVARPPPPLATPLHGTQSHRAGHVAGGRPPGWSF